MALPDMRYGPATLKHLALELQLDLAIAETGVVLAACAQGAPADPVAAIRAIGSPCHRCANWPGAHGNCVAQELVATLVGDRLTLYCRAWQEEVQP